MTISNVPGGRRVALAVLLLAVLGLSSAGAVAAQDQKFAVIDVERILTDSERGKTIIAGIEAFQKQKAEELKTMQTELQELNQRYADSRLSLAEDRLAEMEKELEDRTIAARRAQDDAQRELQKRQREEFAKVETAVLPIITAIGQEQGYTMIFNKFQSGLVYADEAIDITTEVIERFDQSGG